LVPSKRIKTFLRRSPIIHIRKRGNTTKRF